MSVGEPLAPGRGSPLLVTVHLRGAVTGAPMLDGLLAFVVAERAGLVAGFGPLQDVEIPIEREPGGRFHLATSPLVAWERHELRYVNRKFPIAEAQAFAAPSLRRVNIGHGACRSYRIPGNVSFAEGDAIHWYCVGDAEAIRALLASVTHLGKRRAVGRGAVARWEVAPCTPWAPGFPLVLAGKPMRPLPPDWPGLVAPTLAYHTLSFPYHRHTEEELAAVPQASSGAP